MAADADLADAGAATAAGRKIAAVTKPVRPCGVVVRLQVELGIG